eukprot:748378-Hanusia_phi.AAC.7
MLCILTPISTCLVALVLCIIPSHHALPEFEQHPRRESINVDSHQTKNAHRVNFYKDSHGWTISGGKNITGPFLCHGLLCAQDFGDHVWYWSAPLTFTRLLNGSYGGKLRIKSGFFEMQRSEQEKFSGAGRISDVVIRGSSGVAIFAFNLQTYGNYQLDETLPLDGRYEWQDNEGAAVSSHLIGETLRDAVELRIRGGYYPGEEIAFLRSVEIVPPADASEGAGADQGRIDEGGAGIEISAAMVSEDGKEDVRVSEDIKGLSSNFIVDARASTLSTSKAVVGQSSKVEGRVERKRGTSGSVHHSAQREEGKEVGEKGSEGLSVREQESAARQPSADSLPSFHLCGDRRSSSFPTELVRFSEEQKLILLDCIVGSSSSFALTNSSLLHSMDGRVESISLDRISSLTTDSQGKIILLGRWEEEEEEEEPETIFTGQHISTFNIVAMASFLEKVHNAIVINYRSEKRAAGGALAVARGLPLDRAGGADAEINTRVSKHQVEAQETRIREARTSWAASSLRDRTERCPWQTTRPAAGGPAGGRRAVGGTESDEVCNIFMSVAKHKPCWRRGLTLSPKPITFDLVTLRVSIDLPTPPGKTATPLVMACGLSGTGTLAGRTPGRHMLGRLLGLGWTAERLRTAPCWRTPGTVVGSTSFWSPSLRTSSCAESSAALFALSSAGKNAPSAFTPVLIPGLGG